MDVAAGESCRPAKLLSYVVGIDVWSGKHFESFWKSPPPNTCIIQIEGRKSPSAFGFTAKTAKVALFKVIPLSTQDR